MTAEEEAAGQLKQLAMLGDAEFQKMCWERHKMGEKKYGPVNFLQVDSIQMALEEVVDLANYARFTFIKLYMLQQQLAAMTPEDEPEMLGPNSFIPSSQRR